MIVTPVRNGVIVNSTSGNNKIQYKKSSISFTATTVAVTGNIAAGKSTVQKLFEENDIPGVDVDIVVDELYKKDKDVIKDVKNLFTDYGYDLLKDDDFIDRTKIRDIVFPNNQLKKDLEDIVHPAVERKVEEFIQKNKNRKVVAVYNPLLFETNKQSDYDYVVLIKIDPQVQLKRLLSRNSFLTPETATQRINSQMPQFLKESRADFTIDNSNGFESTKKQVDDLISKLNGTFTPNNSQLFIGILFLKYTWAKTLKRIGFEDADISEGFTSVIKAYDDKSRSYHGIKHIERMLKELKEYEINNPDKIKNPEILRYGIFMHDIVNGSKNDVEDSLEIALKLLDKSKNPKFREQKDLLKEIILATKHDSSVPDEDLSLEAKLIADVDLAILGSDKKTYEIYAKQIRREYSQYPDDVYKAGRIAILEGILSKPNIYKLEYFQKKYQQKAEENIRNEIASLRN